MNPSRPLSTGSLVLRFYEEIYRPFMVILFQSLFARNYLNQSSVGTTMSNLNQGILLRMPFMLPPLAEQHRIVQRVDELMALCDQLEAVQTEREQRRDRLNAAALKQLVEAELGADSLGDPARRSARFYLNRLPCLTTKVEHVKALRQMILDLAVRGRLVAQDPEDEPAASLFENLTRSITHVDELREIPQGWCWATLNSI
jgi:type I restriction enzyme, S subunit